MLAPHQKRDRTTLQHGFWESTVHNDNQFLVYDPNLFSTPDPSIATPAQGWIIGGARTEIFDVGIDVVWQGIDLDGPAGDSVPHHGHLKGPCSQASRFGCRDSPSYRRIIEILMSIHTMSCRSWERIQIYGLKNPAETHNFLDKENDGTNSLRSVLFCSCSVEKRVDGLFSRGLWKHCQCFLS